MLGVKAERQFSVGSRMIFPAIRFCSTILWASAASPSGMIRSMMARIFPRRAASSAFSTSAEIGSGGADDAQAAHVETLYVESHSAAAVSAGCDQPSVEARLANAAGQRVGSEIFSQTTSTPSLSVSRMTSLARSRTR